MRLLAVLLALGCAFVLTQPANACTRIPDDVPLSAKDPPDILVQGEQQGSAYRVTHVWRGPGHRWYRFRDIVPFISDCHMSVKGGPSIIAATYTYQGASWYGQYDATEDMSQFGPAQPPGGIAMWLSEVSGRTLAIFLGILAAGRLLTDRTDARRGIRAWFGGVKSRDYSLLRAWAVPGAVVGAVTIPVRLMLWMEMPFGMAPSLDDGFWLSKPEDLYLLLFGAAVGGLVACLVGVPLSPNPNLRVSAILWPLIGMLAALAFEWLWAGNLVFVREVLYVLPFGFVVGLLARSTSRSLGSLWGQGTQQPS